MRSFNVRSGMLELFYQCVVASALFLAVGSSIRASDTNRLNKLIKKAGSVICCKLETLEAVVDRKNILLSIMITGCLVWVTPLCATQQSAQS